MQPVRVIPLFEQSASPPTWNERMRCDEFAVLFANMQPRSVDPSLGPVAALFASLDDAVAFAIAETDAELRLRCSIYDARGLGSPPFRVIAGSRGDDTSFLSSRFRLWAGGICLVTGTALGAAELLSGMNLLWAGMLAIRIGPAGAILLLTEAGVRLSAGRKKLAR